MSLQAALAQTEVEIQDTADKLNKLVGTDAWLVGQNPPSLMDNLLRLKNQQGEILAAMEKDPSKADIAQMFDVISKSKPQQEQQAGAGPLLLIAGAIAAFVLLRKK